MFYDAQVGLLVLQTRWVKSHCKPQPTIFSILDGSESKEIDSVYYSLPSAVTFLLHYHK